MRHDRIERQRPGLDQPDRRGECERGHVRAQDGQRAIRDRVLVDRRACRLVHAEEHDPAAQCGMLDRRRHLGAHRVDDDIRSVGQEVAPSRIQLVGADDDIRPDRARDRCPPGLRLHHDDRVRARGLEHREEEAADRPGAEDDRRLAGPRIRLVDAVHDARQRLDERCDRRRGALGQREHGVGRGFDQRRERPMAEHAERPHVLAARRASRPAWATDAAFRIRIDDHPLADRERVAPRPTGADAADELMPQDHSWIGGVAGRDVEDLEIAAADPARLDLDDDVVVGLDHGLRHVLDRQDARALEDRGLHQAACFRRRRPVIRRARPRASAASPSVPRVTTSMTVATALTSGVTPNLTRV